MSFRHWLRNLSPFHRTQPSQSISHELPSEADALSSDQALDQASGPEPEIIRYLNHVESRIQLILDNTNVRSLEFRRGLRDAGAFQPREGRIVIAKRDSRLNAQVASFLVTFDVSSLLPLSPAEHEAVGKFASNHILDILQSSTPARLLVRKVRTRVTRNSSLNYRVSLVYGCTLYSNTRDAIAQEHYLHRERQVAPVATDVARVVAGPGISVTQDSSGISYVKIEHPTAELLARFLTLEEHTLLLKTLQSGLQSLDEATLYGTDTSAERSTLQSLLDKIAPGLTPTP